MKSGFCHHVTCGKSNDKDGPWQAIEKHQNNITTVAMTPNYSEWYVGYGSNGFTRMGMTSAFDDKLSKARSGSTRINSVSLGRKASYWVIESADHWYFTGSDCFRTAMTCCNDKRVVAIY